MNEKIEVIRNDLLAFDFRKAKEMGIQTVQNDYESFGKQAWSAGTSGNLYLNSAGEIYDIIKKPFEILSAMPTDEIKLLYTELDTLYPKDNDFPDVKKYSDITDIYNVIYKVLIPVELTKRNNGKNNILHTLFFIKLDK